MTKKLNNIINRVQKKKAIGIIYNIPKNEMSIIQNRLLDNKQAIILKGRDAYTAPMFMFRLSSKLKMKKLAFHMIPALIDDKLIAVTGADTFTNSYSRILEDAYKYKVPILLFMNTDAAMTEFRRLKAYNKILTIEQNFEEL